MRKPDIRIGINPIGWSNDDLPSLGIETPLETALSEGAEIGYQGFELGNKFPKTGPELKQKLDEFGVVCVSGWYSAQLGRLDDWSLSQEIEAARPHMEKLQYNDCQVVVYGEVSNSIQGQITTPLSRRPRFTNDDQWQRYAQRLNEFGKHLKESYGLTLAYHHHMGAYVEHPDDIGRLMQLTDPSLVGLLFDTGHCWFGSATNNPDQVIDVKETLIRHIDRVVHVHCKDVRPEVIHDIRNRDDSFLHAVLAGAFTVPGDGAIDFETVLGILLGHGYKGWLVVEAEQDPKIAPPYRYGKLGHDTLLGIIDHHGDGSQPVGVRPQTA
ncbi:MAG: myo-inosose-2 dehydratase [Lautropia sp.]|nr:myo-inosose-2 dehydratase [Lautropia sp.]